MVWTIHQTVDLAHGEEAASRVKYVSPLAYPGDGNAHEWRVTVKENGVSVDLSDATITAYIKRVDGNAVLLDGTGDYEGNATVTFLPECYECPGQIVGIMRVAYPDETLTIGALYATILNDISDSPLIDPSGVIPNIDTIRAQVTELEASMESATNSAIAAAFAANTAAQQVEDIVVVSQTEPVPSQTNKVWIKPDVDEVEVPTMEEYDGLKSRVELSSEHTSNLYDRMNVLKGYFTSQSILKQDDTDATVYIPCKPLTKYTVQKAAGQRFQVGYLTGDLTFDVVVEGKNAANQASKISVVTGENATYLVSYVWDLAADGSNISLEDMLNTVMIEEGDGSAEYVEPFSAVDRKFREDGWMRHEKLSSEDDLNNVTTPGQYYLPPSSMPLNSPVTVASILLVFQDEANDTTTGIVQKVISWRTRKEFVRGLGSGEWTDWILVDPLVPDYANSAAPQACYPNATRFINTGSPYTNYPKVVTLLHCSDVHGHVEEFSTLMNWANNHTNLYDDVLFTGDIVNWYREDESGTGDYLDFWYKEKNSNKILVTIGNHDSKDSSGSSNAGWPRKAMAHCRELYMSTIQDWGVESPDGTTYWYKDYSNGIGTPVRLIGLDSTLYWGDGQATPTQSTADHEAQLAWFKNVLSDAKTKGYAVVAAEHFMQTTTGRWQIDCDFSANNSSSDGPYFWLSTEYLEAVKTFINGGGEFICWLCGHTHADYVVRHPNYENQWSFCVTSLWADLRSSDQARNSNTKSFIAANLISFDTAMKLVKICRVGADYNYELRPRKTFVWNYQTKKIVRQASGENGASVSVDGTGIVITTQEV